MSHVETAKALDQIRSLLDVIAQNERDFEDVILESQFNQVTDEVEELYAALTNKRSNFLQRLANLGFYRGTATEVFEQAITYLENNPPR